MIATIFGLGPDAVSALMASRVSLPGFHGIHPESYPTGLTSQYLDNHQAFPGGTCNVLRHLTKHLIPDSILGQSTIEDIHENPMDSGKLDQPSNATRIRLNATVVRVEHLGSPEAARLVRISYLRAGRLETIRARCVVMASGSWVNRHVIVGLPKEQLVAHSRLHHASTLVANVAVTNWRFMHRLGITGARWFDGFGYATTIRQQMLIGSYRPRLHPDSPCVLTLYVPFCSPGKPVAEQVALGRTELFRTSYAEYESQIRAQLSHLFSAGGFDADRDIAGIILNRWGHSLLVPEPGLQFGKPGQPSPLEIAKKQFGRIAFAHSELDGGQSLGGAVLHAKRAIEELVNG